MKSNQDNKQIALEFLNLVVYGKIDEAYQRHVDMKGKHHNTYSASGFESLKQAMKENHTQFPIKQFKVKHALSDGDFAAFHSHVILNSKDSGIITMHLFKLKNSKIVEMWDYGQLIPKDLPNKDGAF